MTNLGALQTRRFFCDVFPNTVINTLTNGVILPFISTLSRLLFSNKKKKKK